MPENPEATIVAEQLDFYFSNRIVESITYLGGKFKKRDNFIPTQKLIIKRVTNKGKQIAFITNDKQHYFLSHLGMSGRWGFERSKHTSIKISFVVEEENKNVSAELCGPIPILNVKDLYYTDSRRFGNFEIVSSKEYKSKINKLAKSFLSSNEGGVIILEEFLSNYKKYTNNKRM